MVIQLLMTVSVFAVRGAETPLMISPWKKMMNVHRKRFVPCLQKHQDMPDGIIKRLTVYM